MCLHSLIEILIKIYIYVLITISAQTHTHTQKQTFAALYFAICITMKNDDDDDGYGGKIKTEFGVSLSAVFARTRLCQYQYFFSIVFYTCTNEG